MQAQYPGTAALQEQLNTWTEDYEAAEEAKRLEAEKAQADDGWTVVTNKAGRKRASGTVTYCSPCTVCSQCKLRVRDGSGARYFEGAVIVSFA